MPTPSPYNLPPAELQQVLQEINSDYQSNPLPAVTNQLSALQEAAGLTSDVLWTGPLFLKATGLQFGTGQDLVALGYQAKATGPAATAWSDIMQARAVLNQEISTYLSTNPDQAWANPDGGVDTAASLQELQLAMQTDSDLQNANSIIGDPDINFDPPSPGSGNTAPVLQGSVSANSYGPAAGLMNWWQGVQNAFAQAMQGSNQALAGIGGFINQWETNLQGEEAKQVLEFNKKVLDTVEYLAGDFAPERIYEPAAKFLEAEAKAFASAAADLQARGGLFAFNAAKTAAQGEALVAQAEEIARNAQAVANAGKLVGVIGNVLDGWQIGTEIAEVSNAIAAQKYGQAGANAALALINTGVLGIGITNPELAPLLLLYKLKGEEMLTEMLQDSANKIDHTVAE